MWCLQEAKSTSKWNEINNTIKLSCILLIFYNRSISSNCCPRVRLITLKFGPPAGVSHFSRLTPRLTHSKLTGELLVLTVEADTSQTRLKLTIRTWNWSRMKIPINCRQKRNLWVHIMSFYDVANVILPIFRCYDVLKSLLLYIFLIRKCLFKVK